MFWFAALVVLLNAVRGDTSSYIGDIGFNSLESTSRDVKQIVDTDAVYIGADNNQNYAISATELKQFNWASCNVNGDRVSISAPDCNVIEKSLNQLGQDERRVLESVAGRRQQSHSQTVILSGNGNLFQSSSLSSSSISSFSHGNVAYQQVGDTHFALNSANLEAANIKWLFVDDDMVTFVHSDESVNMQPKSCLNSSQQQLLSDLGSEIREAKAKWEAEDQADRERELEEERRERENELEMERLEREQEQEEYQRELELERLESERERKMEQEERERENVESIS